MVVVAALLGAGLLAGAALAHQHFTSPVLAIILFLAAFICGAFTVIVIIMTCVVYYTRQNTNILLGTRAST